MFNSPPLDGAEDLSDRPFHRTRTPTTATGPRPGAGHTITVEVLDRETAREAGMPGADGKRAVVERHDGRLGKICATENGLLAGLTIEQSAQSYAHTYGARYVPAKA